MCPSGPGQPRGECCSSLKRNVGKTSILGGSEYEQCTPDSPVRIPVLVLRSPQIAQVLEILDCPDFPSFPLRMDATSRC